MILFFAIFLTVLVAQGYLSGRFRELLRVDDLHVYHIVNFLALSTAVLAFNFGASWWPLPCAVVCANICGSAFTAAVGVGARGTGRRAVLVRGGRESRS